MLVALVSLDTTWQLRLPIVQDISAAALFLAAKVEEQPRKLDHVVRVLYATLHKDDPNLNPKSDVSAIFGSQKSVQTPWVSLCASVLRTRHRQTVLTVVCCFGVTADVRNIGERVGGQ